MNAFLFRHILFLKYIHIIVLYLYIAWLHASEALAKSSLVLGTHVVKPGVM